MNIISGVNPPPTYLFCMNRNKINKGLIKMKNEELRPRDNDLYDILEKYLQITEYFNDEIEVTSNELVEVINMLRLYEKGFDLETCKFIIENVKSQRDLKRFNSTVKKNKYKCATLLRHDVFIESIEEDLKILKAQKFNTDHFFVVSEFKDSSGKSNKNYILNKEGIRLMLTKESVYVRYVIVRYISIVEEIFKKEIKDKINKQDFYSFKQVRAIYGYDIEFDYKVLKRISSEIDMPVLQEERYFNGKLCTYNLYNKKVWEEAYNIVLKQ